jgi:hypothetical protein
MPNIVSTSSQDWKDKNSNYSIKVPQAIVTKLRKGTKAGNIAAANKAGASAELREAVGRFYGKNVLKPLPKATVPKLNTFPKSKYPNPNEKPKTYKIDPGQRKPTPKEIQEGKNTRDKNNKNKLTPNNREDRRTVPSSPKPMPGPGGRKPAPPRGGPGSKPRPPKKGQTPNQREGRKSVPSVKPGGGPGSKMPKRPQGGPGAKPKSPKVPVIQRGNPKPSQAQLAAAKARAKMAAAAKKRTKTAGVRNKMSRSSYRGGM